MRQPRQPSRYRLPIDSKFTPSLSDERIGAAALHLLKDSLTLSEAGDACPGDARHLVRLHRCGDSPRGHPRIKPFRARGFDNVPVPPRVPLPDADSSGADLNFLKTDLFQRIHREGFVVESAIISGCVRFTGWHRNVGPGGSCTVLSAGPMPLAIDAAAHELARRLGVD